MTGSCKHGISVNAFHCASCANEYETNMAAVDRAPMLCRFLGDSETCRAGLNIAEHNLTSAGWEHPTGLDARGYWAFGSEATQ